MNKKPVGLIIALSIMTVTAATFAVLFIMQSINCSNLEETIKSQNAEIATLKEEAILREQTPTESANTDDATRIIDADEKNGNIGDHVRGKEDSEIVVVEYADLQCPGCASMMPQVKKLTEKYGDKVAFVFRHYPLDGHANALPGSKAAEAAGKQGYFWEMLESLFERRQEWISAKNSDLEDKLVDIFLGVAPEGDADQFVKDMDDANIKKKINFDTKLGRDIQNVNATPSFFVNGEAVSMDNIVTLQDYADEIEKLIEKHL